MGAPERLELLANMAPDTEPLSVNLSRKWRCPSIRNTNLHSVVQPRSKEPLSVSGVFPNQQKDGWWCLGAAHPELPGGKHGYPASARSYRIINFFQKRFFDCQTTLSSYSLRLFALS